MRMRTAIRLEAINTLLDEMQIRVEFAMVGSDGDAYESRLVMLVMRMSARNADIMPYKTGFFI